MNERTHVDVESEVEDGLIPPTPTLAMSRHAPELNQFLRDRGICHVRAEYSGADDRGGFIALEFLRDDGAYCHVSDAQRHLQIKTVLRALLLARHPDWCRGNGSCGDFRWNLAADLLTHSHYMRGNGNERTTHNGVEQI